MDKKRLHRPHGDFACATFCIDDKTVYIVTDVADLEQAFENIQDAVHIFVNAKFDINQFRRFIHYPQRKRLWDCFLIEQILYSGFYESFSLRDLCRRRLDIYLEKEVREEFAEATEMTKEMIEYSCLDTVATWLVYKSQREEIEESDLNIWKKIELPFMWVLLGMSGVQLDTKAWGELAEKNKSLASEIQAKYGELNLNSPAQVKKYLNELGYKATETGEDYLQSISEESEFARDMLSYRNVARRSSTYGAKFVETHVEEDNKIYADIFQIGARTSRTSCRTPNLQNQPNEQAFRSCYVSGKGNKIVVADYESQEPKFAAYFSQDPKLIKAVSSDEKVYIAIARDILERTVENKSKEYKDTKSTILGVFYGMSPYGLARQIGVSEEVAESMIDHFFDVYPGVEDYKKRQLSIKDHITSVSGRKVWINKWNKGWFREALNFPIQSSAADAMKIAARKFADTWCGEDFYQNIPLVLLVHDEIVCCVPESDCDKAAQVLKNSMIETASELHPGIKGGAEIFIGDNWGCKH